MSIQEKTLLISEELKNFKLVGKEANQSTPRSSVEEKNSHNTKAQTLEADEK